jgi:hypothetical protein
MKSTLALITCALVATVACNSNNRHTGSVTDGTTSGTSTGPATGTTSADTSGSSGSAATNDRTSTSTADTSTTTTTTNRGGLETTNSKTAPTATAEESSIGKGLGTSPGTTASTTHHHAKGMHHAWKATSNSSKMIEGKTFEVISFAKGSDHLSDSAKTKLRSLINSARGSGDGNGRINALHAAVWSDHAFPANGKTDLSKSDRNLADKRIDSINGFMKNELNLSDIKTYSMAEKTNWFARAFNTKDAELKSLFAQRGAPSDVRVDSFRAVKAHGGPSKAVILLDLKDQAAKADSASVGRHMHRSSSRDTVSSTTTSSSAASGAAADRSATQRSAARPTQMHTSAEGLHAPARDTGKDSAIPNSIDRKNNGDEGATTDSSRAKLDDLSSERQ